MRLDKFLCDTVNLSRKEARDSIKKGLASVNGVKVTDFGFQVNESSDTVLFKDTPVSYEKYVYYMLNKPDGVVSATTDPNDKTVIDLFADEGRKDLFPVGRLDKDTLGLLIVTNDGDLSHHLTSPRHHVAKTYLTGIDHPLSETDIKALCEGVELKGDGITKPAQVRVLSPELIELTISEGMYHQVKRMLKTVGNEVTSLKRLSIGAVRLDDNLKEGEYRRLTEEEIKLLKE
ncbi:MAG: rRNA pseudouridine synthase [Lachnospiraceae bacterium]|nr:rRNA pseudouridine synthase [Lachnospiraceae bacterium]MBR5994617.1 rRNA pseudouridine synthase [Lachnospiraceae bacterium]